MGGEPEVTDPAQTRSEVSPENIFFNQRVSNVGKQVLKTEGEQFSTGLNLEDQPKEIIGFVQAQTTTEADLQYSSSRYIQNRSEHDQHVRAGLFGEDLINSLRSEDTLFINCRDSSGNSVAYPLFVPAQSMEWNNMQCLTERFGDASKILYYTYPPLPQDDSEREKLASKFKEILDQGFTIFADYYADPEDTDYGKQLLFEVSGYEGYHADRFDDEIERASKVFVTEVDFGDERSIRKSPHTVAEIYQNLVEAGELVGDEDNGVSVVAVVDKKDHERLWDVYKEPFDKLSDGHPSLSGFDKESYIQLLEDPGVMKVVNKVGGEISTLCIFVQDFDRCPWFNKQHYRENYPDYFDSENIFIFPGIVSDERMRGSSYAAKVIDMATKLLVKRDTDILVTFECTEISAQYIPKIVKQAVENSGVATVSSDIEKPVSTTKYIALTKTNE